MYPVQNIYPYQNRFHAWWHKKFYNRWHKKFYNQWLRKFTSGSLAAFIEKDCLQNRSCTFACGLSVSYSVLTHVWGSTRKLPFSHGDSPSSLVHSHTWHSVIDALVCWKFRWVKNLYDTDDHCVTLICLSSCDSVLLTPQPIPQRSLNHPTRLQWLMCDVRRLECTVCHSVQCDVQHVRDTPLDVRDP